MKGRLKMLSDGLETFANSLFSAYLRNAFPERLPVFIVCLPFCLCAL